jgi:hypothetical protein
MRKLATIALLALSLLTVACTESEDVDADFEAAELDEPTDLAIDGEIDTLSERAGGSVADPFSATVGDTRQRPASAPSGEPLTDRVGTMNAALGTAPGESAPGTAECMTSNKLMNGEPVVGIASDELGARARERYEQMLKIRGLR